MCCWSQGLTTQRPMFRAWESWGQIKLIQGLSVMTREGLSQLEGLGAQRALIGREKQGREAVS